MRMLLNKMCSIWQQLTKIFPKTLHVTLTIKFSVPQSQFHWSQILKCHTSKTALISFFNIYQHWLTTMTPFLMALQDKPLQKEGDRLMNLTIELILMIK